ncbi:hypothetical protein DRH13_06485, partial [Candidatus Woesebacteria bacterium]
MINRKILNLALVFFLVAPMVSAQVTSPEQFLGFKVGTEKKLADMFQIIEYFQMLDKQSGRIAVQEVGKTTEGNPFIVAIITSEENQKNLAKYRKYQQLLADPRKISDDEAKKIIAEGKA